VFGIVVSRYPLVYTNASSLKFVGVFLRGLFTPPLALAPTLPVTASLRASKMSLFLGWTLSRYYLAVV
jgi:hypothetical protein